MGHAGAIIAGGTGTAAEKMAAFEAAGIPVARIPSEIPGLIGAALERRRSRGKQAAKSSRGPGASARRGARASSNGGGGRDSKRGAARAGSRGKTARRG